MEENEQLYISRCMVDEEFKKHRCTNYKDYKNCSHAKPHEETKYCYSNFHVEKCECIPVPLEYYIEKILNERK